MDFINGIPNTFIATGHDKLNYSFKYAASNIPLQQLQAVISFAQRCLLNSSKEG